MKKFIPKIYQKDIFSIDYDKLKKKGIKLLVFDLDNTLCKVHDKKPSSKVIDFINKLSLEFKILVASNNTKERVSLFCKNLKCNFLYRSCKPLGKVQRNIKNKYCFSKSEIAIIGDQMVTDILLGNKAGYLTILVDPVNSEYLKVSVINQLFEKIIRNKLNFRNGEYYE